MRLASTLTRTEMGWSSRGIGEAAGTETEEDMAPMKGGQNRAITNRIYYKFHTSLKKAASKIEEMVNR